MTSSRTYARAMPSICTANKSKTSNRSSQFRCVRGRHGTPPCHGKGVNCSVTAVLSIYSQGDPPRVEPVHPRTITMLPCEAHNQAKRARQAHVHSLRPAVRARRAKSGHKRSSDVLLKIKRRAKSDRQVRILPRAHDTAGVIVPDFRPPLPQVRER